MHMTNKEKEKMNMRLSLALAGGAAQAKNVYLHVLAVSTVMVKQIL